MRSQSFGHRLHFIVLAVVVVDFFLLLLSLLLLLLLLSSLFAFLVRIGTVRGLIKVDQSYRRVWSQQQQQQQQQQQWRTTSFHTITNAVRVFDDRTPPADSRDADWRAMTAPSSGRTRGRRIRDADWLKMTSFSQRPIRRG